MSYNQKISKSERAIMLKENEFSDLFLQGIQKLITPGVYLLLGTAGLSILMIIINVITNNPIFIIMALYIGYIMLGVLILMLVIALSTVSYSSYIMRSLIKTSEIFKVSKEEVESIDTIIKRTQHISKLIWILYKMNYLVSLLSDKKSINKLTLYLQVYVNNLIGFLLNLRSDLAIRLAEQQQTLEQAKSEVEQTIKGNTELEQISELQQIRLDKQIEQFEELQRVLVRN